MSVKFVKTTSLGSHKVRGDVATTALAGFRKLNIFVGKNNSGKSRFLRNLLQNKNNLIDENILAQYRVINELHEALSASYSNVLDRPEFFIKEINELLKSESQEFPKKISDLKIKLQRVINSNGDTTLGGTSMKTVAQTIFNVLNSPSFIKLNVWKDEVIYAYIPILRGLRPLVKDESSPVEVYKSEDCYGSRTKFDYFKEGGLDEKVLVFSGLDIYEQIRDMLLSSSRTERDFVKKFENFLSSHFFGSKEVILTPVKDKDVISISIDGEERPIYNLGDGIQSIICNIFLAYKFKDKNLVLFIEEPEIYLHPGMQRVLVEVFLRELENTQVFLTTHSNHFLDLVYDYENEVSIFSFEKEKETFYIEDITKNKTVIDLLGIRNSSVYLANCVVWVEGVSDRIYLKKFIELYKKEKGFNLKEDYHFAVSEYGGANIENFDFLGTEESSEKVRVSSISSKNLIIADNDGNKGKVDKKGKRLKKLEQILGDSFYDEYIEIENLIPYKVYKSVVDKLVSSSPTKAIELKEEVPNIEQEFDEEITKEKAGVVLKKYLIKKKNERPLEYFEADNVECLGIGKKDLADMIVAEIDASGIAFSDLPKPTKKFTEKVVKFIQSRNRPLSEN